MLKVIPNKYPNYFKYIFLLALRDRMKSQFIEHEDQKQQLENIRQQLRSVKDQCDAFRLTMKRYQTNLLEYSHRILKVNIKYYQNKLE